jgi:hypothetical protein
VRINSPVDLFATYAGRKPDLTEWLKGAAMNRDRNLRDLALGDRDNRRLFHPILKSREQPGAIAGSIAACITTGIKKTAIRRYRSGKMPHFTRGACLIAI